ncbi:hypothetical protein ACFQY0_07630 [Haloferula chungangensis]|uniref:Roadblock/LAMTOR2 domain-containing protein n=1 Tax=Haloferula chungangensis TaxID=1048331 RepID=A0ABW2L3X9_9BACT
MSNDKGIFEPKEGFAFEAPVRSPFAANESDDSPFAAPLEDDSPFAIAGEESATRQKSGPSKVSEKSFEPFASSDSKSPFGYEPPVSGLGKSPFEAAGSSDDSKDSFFAMSGPSKDEPAKQASPESSASAAQASPENSSGSDSSSIRQLEVRAVFGVDRELTESELLQRSRALPGIRHLERIADADVGVIDGLSRVLSKLNFGDGKVQLQCNNAPIDFIREGSVLLAVQTDGRYGPGVRETLIIVARELGRM